MAFYLQLVTLTDEGRKEFEDNPDWIKETVNRDIELMGAKILVQYGLLGQYDFINIIEAPSDEVAAKLSIRLSARGTIRPTTLAAIPLDKLVDTLRKQQRIDW